jgi:hypothetical protein
VDWVASRVHLLPHRKHAKRPQSARGWVGRDHTFWPPTNRSNDPNSSPKPIQTFCPLNVRGGFSKNKPPLQLIWLFSGPLLELLETLERNVQIHTGH